MSTATARTRNKPEVNSGVTITPLTGSIGATISGLRLAEVTSDQFAAIREAFLANCMLVFRDQFLSVDEHVAFAARWGEFEVNAMSPYLDNYPMVLGLSNRGKDKAVTENWHYDSTFKAEPPAITMLSAREIPVGGDTMWCNQYLAYEALSPGMKTMLAGVRAEFTGARLAKLYGLDKVPSSLHPVVRTHPETGRKALYCSDAHTTMIDGMTVDESRPLLHYLYTVQQREELQCRFHWEAGSVAFWDNRCAQHNALNDYHGYNRTMYRVTLEGDRPS